MHIIIGTYRNIFNGILCDGLCLEDVIRTNHLDREYNLRARETMCRSEKYTSLELSESTPLLTEMQFSDRQLHVTIESSLVESGQVIFGSSQLESIGQGKMALLI